MAETTNPAASAAQESSAATVQTVTKAPETGTSATADHTAFNSVDQAIFAGSGNLNTESFGPQNPDARMESTMDTVSQMSSNDIHASLENVAEQTPNPSPEQSTDQHTAPEDFRQKMEAILDNDTLTPQERADQVRDLQQNQQEQQTQSSSDASATETPTTDRQTAAETQTAGEPHHVPENTSAPTQHATETPVVGQTQETSPQTQPAAETLPPTNDQLIAQEDNLQQQLNKGEITQEQYRKDMGNLAEQTDMNSSQVGTPESTTIHEPTSDERANGAEVTNNGESMELTPEQKARFEGMQIASELSNLGIDLKSNAGLELARAIAENPALMETVKQTAEAMTKYQETFGPTATQDSAEATQKSLEEQAAKAEATGDKKEAKRVKSLLKILLAITAALAIVAGASVTVGVGQLGNQTK